jgi:hypothetical protein
MPEHASRFAAALYDQFEGEHQVADWGGDDLFTRMPRPRAVDDAPPPRFRPSHAVAAERPLALVDPPEDRRRAPLDEEWSGPRDRRRAMSAEEGMRERAERLDLSVVAESPAEHATVTQWDGTVGAITVQEGPRPWESWPGADDADPSGRRTKVITGRPDGLPRALRSTSVERRRPARTPAEWVGARPERIVAWAFALGLLLILIAISTADAATV